MKQVSGGVGRNIADALGRFGHDVRFLSAVGDDSNGNSILKSLEHIVNKIVLHYNRERVFRLGIPDLSVKSTGHFNGHTYIIYADVSYSVTVRI